VLSKRTAREEGADDRGRCRNWAERTGLDEPVTRERDPVSAMAGPARYEIRVDGVLDRRWTAWFGGLAVRSDGRETVISGEVADQAALHGLLDRIGDLGLVLILVRRLEPGQGGDHESRDPAAAR
jgi:hypothetical protein